MSWTEFSDTCPGCRPAMLDMQTRRRLPDSDPLMRIVNDLWSKTTLEERQAWHRVCCQNSRAPRDMLFASGFAQKIQDASDV